MYAAVPTPRHRCRRGSTDAAKGGRAVRGGGWPWGSSRERVVGPAPRVDDTAPKTPGPIRPVQPAATPESRELRSNVRVNRLCSRGTWRPRRRQKPKNPAPVGPGAEDEEALEDDEDLDVDLDDDSLEEIDEVGLGEDDGDDDIAGIDEEGDEEVDEVDEILTPSPASVVERTGEGDEEEEEEEPDDEDVEASLDVILKERLVVEDEPEDEEADRSGGQGRRQRAGPAQAAGRVRLPFVLLGQAPQPAGGQEAHAVPGLCLTRRLARTDPAEGGPLRRTLDVCLFAPVGVAVSVVEELPDLIAKGRRRVELQIGNALVVGRFVVAKGHQQGGRPPR